ncbi:MAG: hypothetical protein Q9162_001039 [Coniocarpon cinnabarinum]
MHKAFSARSLTQSTVYICLSCRLKERSIQISIRQVHPYATKAQSKRSLHDTKTIKEAENPGKENSTSLPKSFGKKTATEKEDPKTPRTRKSPKQAPGDLTSQDGVSETATHVATAAEGDAGKPKSSPKTKASLKSSSKSDDAIPPPKRKPRGSRSANTGQSEEQNIDDSGSSKPLSKNVDKGAADSKKIRSILQRYESRELPAGISARRIRKIVGTSDIHKLRKLGKGFRKILGQLQARTPQAKRPLRLQKVKSKDELDPTRIEHERQRVADLGKGSEETASRKPRARKKSREPSPSSLQEATMAAVGIGTKDAKKKGSLTSDEHLPRMKANDLVLDTIPVKQPPVAQLAHGLERVLFNPGVYHVRDPRTRTYNFDPHLEKLMPIQEFNFDTLNLFTPPSKDHNLARIAQESAKKYVASTSSLTGTLKHFHYLLSQWRPINFNMLSKAFPTLLTSFTRLQRAPDAIFLRYKDGVYATDSDKFFDSANILSLMGRYMEKLLTVGKQSFLRHKVGSEDPITEKERSEPEAFHYSTLGDFVLRSQLDAQDSRLPGSGIFDLKTRAVVPIRMDSGDYEWGMDYEIRSLAGEWQSFEREYHDMIRSTMLKYSLQVRMGRMDGIFVAFHNIARIFGFQYISLEEMDHALHGQWNRTLGDHEFRLSLQLLNDIFGKVTEKFPKTSLRLHFETRPSATAVPFMYVFAEPVTEGQAESIQDANKEKIREWERSILHGAPTEEGQSASNREHTEQDNPSKEGSLADAADNVEQDMTSKLMAHSAGQHSKTSQEGDIAGSSIADAMRHNGANATADSSKEQTSNSDSQAASPEPDAGPLAAYVLTISNRVNGKYVTRPRNPFTAEDNWEIRYSLLPIDNPKRAWTLYNMCKARRSKELGEEKKKDRDMDYFKNILRRITAEGKKYREEVEAKDEDERSRGYSAKTVWDEDAHKAGEEKTKTKKRTFADWILGR